MALQHSRRLEIVAAICVAAALTMAAPSTIDLIAQTGKPARGSTSTSRVASPAVVASWVSHENDDDSVTTLLVLWRGTPGWFARSDGSRSSAGGSAWGSSLGSGASGSYSYEYVRRGGLTLTMEFDYDKQIVKMLDQQISLKQTNVVLVDFVDSTAGPTIVGYRWVDPPPSTPPLSLDAIAAVVKRTPELFDYLRCDSSTSDPLIDQMTPVICGQMRP